MRKIISLFVIMLLLTACGSGSISKYETIDTNKALELIADGAIILDVRTVEEFNREHIPNDINIPLDHIDSVGFDKDSTIIVYCQSGMRSKQAVEKMVEMEYTSLYNLDGGLLNWGGDLEE